MTPSRFDPVIPGTRREAMGAWARTCRWDKTLLDPFLGSTHDESVFMPCLLSSHRMIPLPTHTPSHPSPARQRYRWECWQGRSQFPWHNPATTRGSLAAVVTEWHPHGRFPRCMIQHNPPHHLTLVDTAANMTKPHPTP
nr:LOW QUALITY PROTEIN: hypothetical protein L203_02597 [Cryptococcus depauperatus CBS 7841]